MGYRDVIASDELRFRFIWHISTIETILVVRGAGEEVKLKFGPKYPFSFLATLEKSGHGHCESVSHTQKNQSFATIGDFGLFSFPAFTTNNVT